MNQRRRPSIEAGNPGTPLRSVAALTPLFRIGAVLLVPTLLVAAQEERRPPKRAAEPFAVHVVVDAEEDSDEQRSALIEGKEELEERLRDNEDWFRLAVSPEEAEILVRLRAYSHRAERRVLSIWGVVPPTEAGQPDRTQVIEIRTHHSLRAWIQLPGARRALRGTKTTKGAAGGPENAASDLAEKLEELVRGEYFVLVERRAAERGR